MRRGRPRKICSHSFGPAKSGALWVKTSCPKGKTSIKVFKGKTAGTLYWLKKKNVKIALHIRQQRFMQNRREHAKHKHGRCTD